MEAAAPVKKPVAINRWLPYWAVFQADLGQTLRSWVYRFWVLASLLAMTGYLLHRVGLAHEFGLVQPASLFMTELLSWYVVGSLTLIVVLTVGSISGERGSMADSVLSRGISRYQYFLGKWHARLTAVLGTFLVLSVLALVSSLMLLHEDLSWTGCLMALATVAAMLIVVATAGVTISSLANSTVLGMAILILLLPGLGFALTVLPPQFPTPDRVLKKMPFILRGYFDLELLSQLIFSCLLVSLAVAVVGLIHFSRRDV